MDLDSIKVMFEEATSRAPFPVDLTKDHSGEIRPRSHTEALPEIRIWVL